MEVGNINGVAQMIRPMVSIYINRRLEPFFLLSLLPFMLHRQFNDKVGELRMVPAVLFGDG